MSAPPVCRADAGLAMARALCAALAPPGSGVEVLADDSQTAFVPSENRILISRRYLADETNVALGAVAHESGHLLVTRYQCFLPVPGAHEVLWRKALNAMEENRVHSFLHARLPGIGTFLRALFDTDPRIEDDHFESTTLAFLGAAATWDRRSADSFLAPLPAALEAFRTTAAARQRYATILPPADFAPGADAGDRYMRDAVPLLKPSESPNEALATTPVEMEVVCAAAAAHRVFVDALWPQVEALVDQDRARIATALAARPSLLAAAEVHAKRPEGAAIAHEALCMVPDGAALDHEAAGRFGTLAAQLFDRYLEDPERVGVGIPGGGTPPQAPAGEADDQAVEAALRAALPRQRRRWSGGWRGGPRLDLPIIMRARAQGRCTDRIWMRREISRPALAVLLLVDLSGSMAGEKVEAAIAASRALSLALARIEGVNWSVVGFQDVIIPIVGFDEPADAAALARIQAMREEVAGTRAGPGANNRPSHNDDGPCLLDAAAQLATRPEPDRLLIVISDGQPAGRRSDRNDLHKAVARVDAEGGIALVGLGLGPRTEHVTDYYPVSKANVPLAELAPTIGDLLATHLGGSR